MATIPNRARRILLGGSLLFTGSIASILSTSHARAARQEIQVECSVAKTILSRPTAITLDAQGNIYETEGGWFTSDDKSVVRKVNPVTGDTTVIAGVGPRGYSGDGGLALNAKLKGPSGVAVNAVGDVYIADTDNHRIRRVDHTTGIISTIAGTGQATGDSNYPPNTLATAVSIATPFGLVMATNGDLYFSQYAIGVVSKIDHSTGFISNVAGTGQNGAGAASGTATSVALYQPTWLALDGSGNLLIADTDNHRIRKVTPGGSMTSIAGTGSWGYSGDGSLATSAQLNAPQGLGVDAAGNIYVGDSGNDLVRKIDHSTGVITSIIGVNGDSDRTYGHPLGGTQALGTPVQARGIAVTPTGKIYIANIDSNTISAVDQTTGILTRVTGGSPNVNPFAENGQWGDGGKAKYSTIQATRGLYVDPATSDIYLSDDLQATLRKINGQTGIITKFAGGRNGEYNNRYVGLAMNAYLWNASGPVRDAAGDFYFVEANSTGVVRKIDHQSGVMTTIAGGGLGGDGGLATDAALDTPTSLAFDEAGNLFISEWGGANDIRRVDYVTGRISTVAGTSHQYSYTGDGGLATSATFSGIQAIMFDHSGNLIVADTGNQVIRKINQQSGIVTTIAGTETNGYSGDGGLATNARLNFPSYQANLALDTSGNIYWPEGNNSGGVTGIRKLDVTSGNISTVIENMTGAIGIDQTGHLFLGDGNAVYKYTLATDALELIAGYPNMGNSLCNLNPSFPAAVTSGSAPNSQVATVTSGSTSAFVPATASLPSTTLNFSSTSGSANVIVVPIATNPAASSATPFMVTGSTKFVDIQVSGISGDVTVCIDGAATDSLFHFSGGQWVELPQRTYADGQVCGVTSSFSPFVTAYAQPLPTTAIVAPTTSTTTIVAPTTSTTVATPVAVTIGVKKSFSAKALAKLFGVSVVSTKATVTMVASKSSSKVCIASQTQLKTLKAGSCLVTFTIQEPTLKGGKKPSAKKTVKSLTVK